MGAIRHYLDPFCIRDGRARYLCIHACYPTYDKLTTNANKVTCKNCKRALKMISGLNMITHK